ncbi:MAG TPA: metallophosphoesterase family protein, partial [Planctomycetota bacterium]|nr:metallophosphoesterase family protein [Planctomycetota bacterium]
MKASCAGLMLCVAAAPAFGQASLTRGPAVCKVAPMKARIQWTTSPASAGAVEWGPTPALGNTASGTGTTALHEVLVTGLTPSTTFYYRVLADGVPVSATFPFRTAHQPLYPFTRIAAFGDSGHGSAEQYAVASLVEALAPEMVLIAGDVIYPAGEASDMDEKYFVPYAGLLPHVPFYLALGNHDYETDCGEPYVDNFCLPTSSAGGERYYSFKTADILVVSVDSEFCDPGGLVCSPLLSTLEQLDWLDEELAGSDARWKIVFFHHPPYSDGSHGDNPIAQSLLVPIFEERGVDLVISGHDHSYQRFPNLLQGSPDPTGPRYVVAGTGGNSGSGVTPGPLLEVGFESQGTFLLDVSGNQIRCRFVGADPGSFGEVLDDFTMSKGPTTPTVALSAEVSPPGSTPVLTVRGEAGETFGVLFSLGTGYAEAPPHGVVLLDMSLAAFAFSGTLPVGVALLPLPIPPVPALSGMRLYFQGAAT